MKDYGITVTCTYFNCNAAAKVKAVFSVHIGGKFQLKSSPTDDIAEGAIVINDIKLVQMESGKFVVSYPYLYTSDRVRNHVYPVTKPLGSLIEGEILRLYQIECKKMEQIAA